MLRHIEFTIQAFSTVYGTFGIGDTGRFPADVAAHFVDEAKCAKYLDHAVPTAEKPAPEVQIPVPADPLPAELPSASSPQLPEAAPDVQTPAPAESPQADILSTASVAAAEPAAAVKPAKPKAQGGKP